MTQLSRWKPTSGRAKLVGLLATGLLVAGCGGEDAGGGGSGSKDEALTKAAQWATGQALRAEVDDEDGEIVVMRHGTPRYTATKITRSPDDMTAMATLTGEVPVTVSTPNADDRMRLAIATEGTTSRPFEAQVRLTKDAQGRWGAYVEGEDDDVEVELLDARALPQADVDGALAAATDAARATLTWPGDAAAYAQAQDGHYLTRAVDVVATRPELDAPPALQLDGVFPRDEDDQEDDVQVGNVFPEPSAFGGESCELDLGRLQVTSIGARHDCAPEAQLTVTGVDAVAVRGRLRLATSSLECRLQFGNHVEQKGPEERVAEWTAVMVRPRWGEDQRWSVGELSIGPAEGAQDAVYAALGAFPGTVDPS